MMRAKCPAARVDSGSEVRLFVLHYWLFGPPEPSRFARERYSGHAISYPSLANLPNRQSDVKLHFYSLGSRCLIEDRSGSSASPLKVAHLVGSLWTLLAGQGCRAIKMTHPIAHPRVYFWYLK